jgi:predicted small lipoprotein YifL
MAKRVKASGLCPTVSLLVVTTLSTLFVGCGPAGPLVAPVRGKVMYKDKPVPKANIVFTPAEKSGMSAMGITDENGEYELTTFGRNDGAILGLHKVSIAARAPYDGKVPPGMGAAYLEELETQGKPLIPERYFNVEKSGLTADVKSGSNTINFTLKNE